MPRRGEVWWVDLDPTRGSEIKKPRPCVVITSDIINERRRTVVVIPLSSVIRSNPPLLVSVACAGKTAVAVIDQVRAVAKERLQGHLGALSAKHLEAVEEGLREVLGLDSVGSADNAQS